MGRLSRFDLYKLRPRRPPSDERGPCDGNGNLPRTDSDRYAELRALVEAWQAKREDALLIGGTEPQSLTDAANDLATWRHR